MTGKKLPLIVFGALVLTSGVLHGLHTERWRPSPDVEAAVRRLDAVPAVVGDWRSENLTIEDDLSRAGIKGYLNRRYRNSRTGATVSVLIVCGRPGPISVHTPDVCYRGAGYELAAPPQRKEVSAAAGSPGQFWAGRFHKPASTNPAQLDILWSWNGGEGWQAPDRPRMAFARSPALYKLYVIRELVPGPRADKQDPSAEFVKEFLPEVTRALTPAS